MNTEPASTSIKQHLASFFADVERETGDALRYDERRHQIRVLPGFLTLKVTLDKDELHLLLLTDEGLRLIILIEKDGSPPSRRTLSLDASPALVAQHLIAAL